MWEILKSLGLFAIKRLLWVFYFFLLTFIFLEINSGISYIALKHYAFKQNLLSVYL